MELSGCGWGAGLGSVRQDQSQAKTHMLHRLAFLKLRLSGSRQAGQAGGAGRAGVRNMIFILRNLSANNKNDLRQIMATGDDEGEGEGDVLLRPRIILMQISHGQRICKGRAKSASRLTVCAHGCALPAPPVPSRPVPFPFPTPQPAVCLGICLDL